MNEPDSKQQSNKSIAEGICDPNNGIVSLALTLSNLLYVNRTDGNKSEIPLTELAATFRA